MLKIFNPPRYEVQIQYLILGKVERYELRDVSEVNKTQNFVRIAWETGSILFNPQFVISLAIKEM